MNPANLAILTAGLAWLYDTEQPDGANLQHHGVRLAGEDNRSFSFVPMGTGYRAPVVVVDVIKVEWIDNGPNQHKTPANPLLPDELAELSATLTALGADVDHTWNGHPQITGSVGLKGPAHPSLLAAVANYRAGCQEHPVESVFCDCGWARVGRALVVPPAIAVPAA